MKSSVFLEVNHVLILASNSVVNHSKTVNGAGLLPLNEKLEFRSISKVQPSGSRKFFQNSSCLKKFSYGCFQTRFSSSYGKKKIEANPADGSTRLRSLEADNIDIFPDK